MAFIVILAVIVILIVSVLIQRRNKINELPDNDDFVEPEIEEDNA